MVEAVVTADDLLPSTMEEFIVGVRCVFGVIGEGSIATGKEASRSVEEASGNRQSMTY